MLRLLPAVMMVLTIAILLTDCERNYYHTTIMQPTTDTLDTLPVEPPDTLVDADTISPYYGVMPMVNFDQEYGIYNGQEQVLAFKFISNASIFERDSAGGLRYFSLVRQWRWIVPDWETWESKVYGTVVDLQLRIAPHWQETILDTVDVTWWYEARKDIPDVTGLGPESWVGK